MQSAHHVRIVRASGTQEWWLDDKLHREGDLPARIWASGTEEWWRNGQRHREGDLPAYIEVNKNPRDGWQDWWRDGQLHRGDDQPARVGPDGTQEWHTRGKRHRDGGKPAVILSDGTQQWWVHSYKTSDEQVTDFGKDSYRFAFVRAVVCAGVSACVPCDADSAVCSVLQAVHALPCGTLPYHVTHEHAFLVALFL